MSVFLWSYLYRTTQPILRSADVPLRNCLLTHFKKIVAGHLCQIVVLHDEIKPNKQLDQKAMYNAAKASFATVS